MNKPNWITWGLLLNITLQFIDGKINNGKLSLLWFIILISLAIIDAVKYNKYYILIGLTIGVMLCR